MRQHRKLFDLNYTTLSGDFCVYCHDSFEVLDHIPPLAAYVKGNHSIKVPSCKECNSILNANPFKDLRVRRYFILRGLFKKYKKLIKMPRWTNKELDELEGSTKTFVMASILQKKILAKRILYLNKRYRCPDGIEINDVLA